MHYNFHNYDVTLIMSLRAFGFRYIVKKSTSLHSLLKLLRLMPTNELRLLKNYKLIKEIFGNIELASIASQKVSK